MIEWVNENRILFITLWDCTALAGYTILRVASGSTVSAADVVKQLNEHQAGRQGVEPEKGTQDVLDPEMALALEPARPDWMS